MLLRSQFRAWFLCQNRSCCSLLMCRSFTAKAESSEDKIDGKNDEEDAEEPPKKEATHWDMVYKTKGKKRKKTVTFGQLKEQIQEFEEIGQGDIDYVTHVVKHMPKGVLDLGFLGPEYVSHPHYTARRRLKEKYVPPPPKEGEFEKDTFVVAPTPFEAQFQDLHLSATKGQYQFFRHLYNNELTLRRKIWLAEYRAKAAKQAEKNKAEFFQMQRDSEETRRIRQIRTEENHRKDLLARVELAKVYAIKQQIRNKRRDARLTKRRQSELFQVMFLQQERSQWLTVDGITEALFTPDKESSLPGWWPEELSEPLVAQHAPFSDALQQKLSLQWTIEDTKLARRDMEKKLAVRKGAAW